MFPPVRQTIPGGTDAILCYVYGDHNRNVSYKYEGILKVVRRSRATLIFSMGVPLVKPHGSRRTGILLNTIHYSGVRFTTLVVR